MKNVMLTEDHIKYMREKKATLSQVIVAQTSLFDKRQIHEIEEGIAYGIDISIYVDPDIPWENMKEIRFGLMEGVTEKAFITFAHSPHDVLKKVRQVLQSEQMTYDDVKNCKTIEDIETKLPEPDYGRRVTNIAENDRSSSLHEDDVISELRALRKEVISLRKDVERLDNVVESMQKMR